jgi:hypothetical protein
MLFLFLVEFRCEHPCQSRAVAGAKNSQLKQRLSYTMGLEIRPGRQNIPGIVVTFACVRVEVIAAQVPG